MAAVKLSAMHFADYDFETQVRNLYRRDPVALAVKEVLKKHEVTEELRKYFLGHAISDFSRTKSKMILIHDRLLVPSDKVLRLKLFKATYDSKVGSYRGRIATYDLLHRNYCWPNMTQDVARFFSNYRYCIRIKKLR